MYNTYFFFVKKINEWKYSGKFDSYILLYWKFVNDVSFLFDFQSLNSKGVKIKILRRVKGWMLRGQYKNTSWKIKTEFFKFVCPKFSSCRILIWFSFKGSWGWCLCKGFALEMFHKKEVKKIKFRIFRSQNFSNFNFEFF